MSLDLVGKWAFLIGLVIAVIAGFIPGYTTTILLVLFILGLLVGFLNIAEKNTIKFLVAAIALLSLGLASISALSILGTVTTYVNTILGTFVSFVSAAVLVVAIKAIIETGKK